MKRLFLLVLLLLQTGFVFAQHSSFIFLDDNGKDASTHKTLKPYKKQVVIVDGDSCSGKMEGRFSEDNKQFDIRPIRLWTCYYKNGKLKSRTVYNFGSWYVESKIVDSWMPDRTQIVKNGIGFIISISRNYPSNTYDSIITQIVDSLPNGYRETWYVDPDAHKKYRSELTFYKNGLSIDFEIYFHENGRVSEFYTRAMKEPKLSFYENGSIQSMEYIAPLDTTSYCFNWYSDGNLQTAYEKSNRHINGDFLSFQPNGMLLERGKYIQSPGDDTLTFVDPTTGKTAVEYRKTKFSPAKDGIWTRYDSTGAVMRKEIYHNGKLE